MERENKEGTNERKMSAYITMSGMRKAMNLNRPILILMNKNILLNSNELTKCVHSVFDDLG